MALSDQTTLKRNRDQECLKQILVAPEAQVRRDKLLRVSGRGKDVVKMNEGARRADSLE
jgi:hypothetical protein